jgi:energy-coupling factor transporter ATP-binding protein EcfA2
MTAVSSPALSLFYCYAHEDASLRTALDTHLATLKRLNLIQSWSDLDISAGTDWQEAMDYYLSTADILLLLVSVDFLASDYYYSVAMQQALQRHQAGEAVVIPIILSPVDWKQTPLSTLQTLPRDGLPVTQWNRRDEAWKQIATEIRTVVEALRRPVVVASLPQQQAIATRLISFLEARRIPISYVEHAAKVAELQKTTGEVSAVVLVASPETRSAHLLKEIRHLASLDQRPVFVLWIAGNEQDEDQENPPAQAWGKFISLDPVSEGQEVAFQELLHHLKLQRHSAAFPTIVPSQNALVPLPEPRNPYKGLRPFTSNDTHDFFGRMNLIDELVSSIETMLTLAKQGKQQSRLLAVVGPSGSGKSSVVMAGLLPRLRAGKIFESETWTSLEPIVPGEHPIDALAHVLFEHFPEKNLQALRDDLQLEDVRGLHLYASALARRTKSASPHVVLIVDQFEELFTHTANEQERQQFIDLLITACTQREGSLIVILMLRADFYDRPVQYPALYTLIEKHQAAMLPMTQDDLRAVITQPAALPDVQLTFEGSLVGDLLFDVQGQSGALPLLQFTLDQLFQQRDGHQLTLQAYQEMGGVKGALSRHAEQTYYNLPSSEHRTCARALFLRLIDPGFTEQDTTRRRADLSEFIFANPTQTQCMQETIEMFIQARLLTTKQSGKRTTIEVSHEAVIREWKLLADWLREARDDIRFQQAFSEDVAEWERQKQPKDQLYRGAQLKEARAWAKRNTASMQEIAFLRASATQWRLSLLSLVVVISLLASLLGGAVELYRHQFPLRRS